MTFRIFFASVLILSAAILGGCASDSAAQVTTAAPRHPEALLLKVTGGSDAAAASTSQVAHSGFVKNVTHAIEQKRLFNKVVSATEPGVEYQLEIAIADLQPPEIGASMTATVESTWTLTRVSNGYQIWQKTISASHTTQPNEAFNGVERVRLAIEGASRANIRDGVEQLGASLP